MFKLQNKWWKRKTFKTRSEMKEKKANALFCGGKKSIQTNDLQRLNEPEQQIASVQHSFCSMI